MKAFLLEFLPRLVPGWRHEEHFLLVPHEGKSDLDKSIPRKVKAWREPGVRFVIARDVRLICQELEAWYLAQANTLAGVYLSFLVFGAWQAPLEESHHDPQTLARSRRSA